VSENNCRSVGSTKVMGRNASRGKSWGSVGKLP